MNAYTFELGSDARSSSFTVRFLLRSDLDASVRAFDLLRSHPECGWVVAIHDGQAILRRERDGQKQKLTWLQPRPTPVSRHAGRAPSPKPPRR